jgi:hypothetical protein
MPPEAYSSNKATTESIPDSAAEIAINCWYFFDDQGLVLRLAAKAYALTGTDSDKLSALRTLAGSDYLTAAQSRVPEGYVTDLGGRKLQGCIPVNVLQMDPVPVFEEMFKKIEEELPDLIRVSGAYHETFQPKLCEPFLWVSTSVYESPDGQLIARIQ